MDQLKISEKNNYDRTKNLKILIVDDDTKACKSFKKILELRGHNVTLLDEGMRCVGKCIDTSYDLIFMDYHIGDETMNGDEVTEIIKNDFNNKSIIFAYTGDKTADAITTFKKKRMDGAIIKPIGIDLLNKFMNVLEKDSPSLDREALKKISKKSRGNIMIFEYTESDDN
jgi:CheY-like chemotaxis protein